MLQKSIHNNKSQGRIPTSIINRLKIPQGRKFATFVVVLATLFMFPAFAFATTLSDFVAFFVDQILNPLIVVIVGLAVVYWLWGISKYILHADDAKAREEGRSMMIMGVIAIFVMVSMWGLINVLTATFKLDSSSGLPDAEEFLP
ncbi:MAG: hypothetical protein Q7S11_02885 [bacterium]|nr:hypothetical protein [bacterium]